MAHGFLDEMKARGIERLGETAYEPLTGGGIQRMVAAYRKINPGCFELLSSKPTDFGRDVLGNTRPAVNRSYGMRREPYRGFLRWLAETHGF